MHVKALVPLKTNTIEKAIMLMKIKLNKLSLQNYR